MSWIGVGTSVVGGALSFFGGAAQKREAKKLLAQNQEAQRGIDSENAGTLGIATDMANTGLPSQQYAKALQNINRSQNAAISTAQSRRGALGSISSIQRNTNDALLGLDVQNANARNQNMKNLLGVRRSITGDKQARVLGDKDYAMSLQGQGNANQMGGIDRAIGGVGTALYLNGGLGLGNGGYKDPFENISGRAPRPTQIG